MGGLAPGQLKSRRGWHSSPRRLHYRFSFFDRVLRTHCGKNSINFAGMAHSHRHRLAAAWPSLVRQIGPVLRRRRQLSKNVLKYLFPLPNRGSPNAIANNYVQNFPTPISSNQGDVRIDQNISSRHTAFARFTWKQRSVFVTPQNGGTTNGGSALLGPYSLPETDYGLTVAHNFVISPALLNEVRGGFTAQHTATSFGITPSVIAGQLGLTGLPPYPSGTAVPNFNITGFHQ